MCNSVYPFFAKNALFFRVSPNFSADTVRASVPPNFLTQLELVMVVMVVTKGMSETLSVESFVVVI